MKFHVGDAVMHWRHGLGQITALEERNMVGKNQLCYVVKVRDMDIWVPADELLADRLRAPISASALKQLFAILSGPAQSLPDERHERKSQLSTRLADGSAVSRCHVIRDLTAREQAKSLNDDDRTTLKWARSMLLGEWAHCLGIPPAQAEEDLGRLLKQPVAAEANPGD